MVGALGVLVGADEPFAATRIGLPIALALSWTPIFVIVLHELAHAFAAWTTNFHLQQIRIGGGAPFRTRWIGNTLLTLSWSMHEGCVMATSVEPRWYRTRFAAICLAGPLCNIWLTGMLALLWSRLPADRTELQWGVGTATVVSAWLAFLSLLPLRLGRYRDELTDMALFVSTVRLDDDTLRTLIEHNAAQDRQWQFQKAFLQGRYDDANTIVARRLEAEPHDEAALGQRSLLRACRGDYAGAIADIEAAAHIRREQVPAIRAQHGYSRVLARWQREHEKATTVNRAFWQALLGDPDTLRAADDALQTAAAGHDRPEVPDETDCALRRALALVCLMQGRASEAEDELTPTLRSTEPYWLRALSLRLLGHARSLQGDARGAARWTRRARRLHPTGLLQDTVADRLERAAMAREQAQRTIAAR